MCFIKKKYLFAIVTENYVYKTAVQNIFLHFSRENCCLQKMK